MDDIEKGDFVTPTENLDWQNNGNEAPFQPKIGQKIKVVRTSLDGYLTFYCIDGRYKSDYFKKVQ